MKIDFELIRELLAMVSQTEVTELTIESGEEKITLRQSPPQQLAGTTVVEVPRHRPPVELAPPPPVEQKVESNGGGSSNGMVPISSPMVGTFYRAPSPTAPPFVEVGDRIAVGQTVCIIEAMKLMNDLPAEVSGKVVKVLAESGTTVEYGQALFMVDPNA